MGITAICSVQIPDQQAIFHINIGRDRQIHDMPITWRDIRRQAFFILHAVEDKLDITAWCHQFNAVTDRKFVFDGDFSQAITAYASKLTDKLLAF